MAKAYSYTRFSSARQAAGDSLRRQLAAAYAYADEHGLELDTSLQDLGVSGYTGANRTRGALKVFLDQIERGEIERGSYLLIDSMDRLSRLPVADASYQLLGIALAGVQVVTLNNGRVFDEHCSLVDMILAVAEIDRSHRESAEKGRKIAEAHGNSKRRAREEGRVWSKHGPAWLLLNEHRRWQPIPEKVSVVNQVFEWADELGLGCAAIARRLNEQRVPAMRHGQGWLESAVLKLMKNRMVLGEYQPRFRDGTPDGDPVPGYYGDAVIDPARFFRIQERLARSRSQKGRRNGHERLTNLLQGYCFCARCEGAVGSHIRSKDKRALYLCSKGRRGLCDNRRRYRVAELEAAILRHVVELDPGTEPTSNVQATALALATERLNSLKTKVERLLDQLEDGDTVMTLRYRERVAEMAAAEAEVQRLSVEADAHSAQPSPDTYIDTIRRLRDQLTSLAGAELYDVRARLSASLKSIIDEVVFGENAASEPFVTVSLLKGAKTYVFRGTELVLSVDNSRAIVAEGAEGEFAGADIRRRRILAKLAEGELDRPVEVA
jgi:DNA invertase Pin-like site-specific DNA recombinase